LSADIHFYTASVSYSAADDGLSSGILEFQLVFFSIQILGKFSYNRKFQEKYYEVFLLSGKMLRNETTETSTSPLMDKF